jgi:2,3-bisphosphoglycerate-dependent phosphoglycerate mutase
LSVEIVFEKHSTTVDNEAGIATGWADGELSERGRQQAKELGERRADDGLTAVFTSDLGRAVETAAIAFGGSGIPVLEDWRLRECDYGELNRMLASRLEAERSLRIDEPFPGGESYRQVVERVRAFLDDRLRHHDGARILVIGHSATRWALDHLLTGVPLEEVVGPFEWQQGWEYVLPK